MRRCPPGRPSSRSISKSRSRSCAACCTPTPWCRRRWPACAGRLRAGRRARGGRGLRRRAVRAVRRQRPLSPLALEPALAAAAAAGRPRHDLPVHGRLLHAGGHARAVGRDALDGAGRRLGRRAGRDRAQRRSGSTPRAGCARPATSGLGWAAVIAVPQMVAALPLAPVALFALGGVLYTVGRGLLRARPPQPVAAACSASTRSSTRSRCSPRWPTSWRWPGGSCASPVPSGPPAGLGGWP